MQARASMASPLAQARLRSDSIAAGDGQHTLHQHRLKNAPPPADRLSSQLVAHHIKVVVRACERQQQSHPQSDKECEDKAAGTSKESPHAIPCRSSKLALERSRSGPLWWRPRPGAAAKMHHMGGARAVKLPPPPTIKWATKAARVQPKRDRWLVFVHHS